MAFAMMLFVTLLFGAFALMQWKPRTKEGEPRKAPVAVTTDTVSPATSLDNDLGGSADVEESIELRWDDGATQLLHEVELETLNLEQQLLSDEFIDQMGD